MPVWSHSGRNPLSGSQTSWFTVFLLSFTCRRRSEGSLWGCFIRTLFLYTKSPPLSLKHLPKVLPYISSLGVRISTYKLSGSHKQSDHNNHHFIHGMILGAIRFGRKTLWGYGLVYWSTSLILFLSKLRHPSDRIAMSNPNTDLLQLNFRSWWMTWSS